MTTAPPAGREVACVGCDKRQTSKRLPFGWHTDGGDRPHCKDCWNKAYRPLTVTGVVAGPLTDLPPQEAGELWAELRAAVMDAWGASTRLANWTVTELLRSEPGRAHRAKLEKLTAYLYGLFGGSPLRGEWGGATQSANAVMRWAEAKYRDQRFAVQVTNAASAMTFRWPVPLPVPEQSWSLRTERDHFVLGVPLGGQKWDLRLRNDPTMGRHRERLGQLLDGRAVPGELRLCGNPAGDDRNGVRFRRPGGGESRHVRLMARISGWFPKGEPVAGEGDLLVTTGAASLLSAVVPGDTDPWVVHADHVREWVIASAAMRRRWSDDLKAEGRTPARIRRRRADAAERHNGKYARRLDSACEEISAWVANYAARRKVGRVVYDDAVRDWCPAFAYSRLRESIRRKVGERGLEFVASGEAVEGEEVAATA